MNGRKSDQEDKVAARSYRASGTKFIGNDGTGLHSIYASHTLPIRSSMGGFSKHDAIWTEANPLGVS